MKFLLFFESEKQNICGSTRNRTQLYIERKIHTKLMKFQKKLNEGMNNVELIPYRFLNEDANETLSDIKYPQCSGF